jgi:phosphohistidine phosphatase
VNATRRLLLLRHAKSSWDDPDLSDHDRPLAPRGRRAAKLIGSHLREKRIGISLVLCSSARRARETAELAELDGELLIEHELYGASPSQLLDRLRRVPEDAEVVILVGHNPTMQELAIELSGYSGELAGRKFPTAALATFSIEGSWRELDPLRTRLVSFITPRELR